MPRIAREDYATIRHRIDVEGHKVAEVAAAYGCTPANIYAILAKLRRQEAPGAGQTVAVVSIAKAQAIDTASADLLSGLTAAVPVPATPAAKPEQPARVQANLPAPAVTPPPPTLARTERGAAYPSL